MYDSSSERCHKYFTATNNELIVLLCSEEDVTIFVPLQLISCLLKVSMTTEMNDTH